MNPDSLPDSAKDPPEIALNDSGHTSESFNRNCASSQAPRNGSSNYDNLSYDRLRGLCKQRCYHRREAKAGVKARLEALEAVGHRPPGGAQNDMDTSSPISGRRSRDLEESPLLETSAMGTNGKRLRRDAFAAALAADKSVIQGRAQWWHPTM